MKRVVFMGTPQFAVSCLEALLESECNIVAVVTQPDRPQGRKKVLTPSPVKEAALRRHLPVLQPDRMRDKEAVEELASFHPDLIVTAAYGQILPKSLLSVPELGCVNVHGSLLPAYRGGAPIQRSIINGETKTGITLMYMAAGLDTGDMIAKREVDITDEDTSGTLFGKMGAAGAELLKSELPRLLAGRVDAEPQDESLASYAPNLTRGDERIDWTRSPREIFNRVRGLSPFSGGYTLWNEEVFKVWEVERPEDNGPEGGAAPGTVLDVSAKAIVVACGGGAVRLTKVQPAGKKAMPVSDFARGTAMKSGTVLG
ncbi:methionyl-tRNA formyltransferase [Saccharibacillus sp. CPCC 101409]|uniref:methionyl-tRNA formyltransferase n=1 Tax=Saccharibacillus sp. CPCC 101409 TaxID=3058041 RepID=UPI0026729283|nr:methionyl-tRNA formyltransferase [Saccharibacillus sp. CPCC 101409]MDO3409377.1 methionyl-tRNA formyltransferase [Saccharibacillus sp. CPCC 101409]